uniref:Uncharacterized protein n=1 Tax=Physcomitrium patens TaxID=3218 RepID=A0A2K1JLN3_PHYPA|nr:hypothetical protein PHYPA_017258 [Physcomitrium patens]
MKRTYFHIMHLQSIAAAAAFAAAFITFTPRLLERRRNSVWETIDLASCEP